MKSRSKTYAIALVLASLPLGPLAADKVICADFCEGQPLVHADGTTTRTMYLNRCDPNDTFALECDTGDTTSCACKRTSEGHIHARGSERGDPARCSDLCPTLDNLTTNKSKS
jgi:hypothetical protein